MVYTQTLFYEISQAEVLLNILFKVSELILYVKLWKDKYWENCEYSDNLFIFCYLTQWLHSFIFDKKDIYGQNCSWLAGWNRYLKW